MRMVTDGTLYNEISNNILIKKKLIKLIDGKKDIIYTNENVYDILIVDESHEHNLNMDLIITLLKFSLYYNNSIKLVIISATMDNDEYIYRRFFKSINDNRMYPLNSFIKKYNLNRLFVDRHLHISELNKQRYRIDDIYLSKKKDEFEVLKKEILEREGSGDILIFEPTISEIYKLVKKINEDNEIRSDIIALPFFGRLASDKRDIIQNIDSIKNKQKLTIPKIDKYGVSIDYDKYDFNDPNREKVSEGTYKRVILVATNVAEASITINTLKFVIDTGTENVVFYDTKSRESISKIKSITDQSRVQRRGRVGRVSSGKVYYLYKKGDKEDVEGFYGINTQDLTFNIYNLLSSKSKNKKYLFNKYNDPNFKDNNFQKDYLESIFKYNIGDIIYDQYFMNDIFYDYHGEYSHNIRPCNFYHDGFGLSDIVDSKGDFYVVHPDEKYFSRNINGDIVSIKDSDYVNILEEYYNKISISSIKIYNYLENLRNFLFLSYDIKNNIHIKTRFGLNIERFNRNTLGFNNINLLIAFIYSIGYDSTLDVIKILSFLKSSFNKIDELILSENYFSNVKKLKNMYNDNYGDINIYYELFSRLINKFSYLSNLDKNLRKFDYNINFDKIREKFIKLLHSYGSNLTMYLSNIKNFGSVYAFESKSEYDEIIKLNTLYNKNLLFLNDINSSNEESLYRNNFLEERLNNYLIEDKNKYIINSFCKNNYLNQNNIIKLLKTYNNLLNKYKNLIDNNYDIDYDDETNNVNYEWIKDNISNLVSKKENYYENYIKPLLHSYGSNFVFKFSDNYYFKVIYPDPEYFVSVNSFSNKNYIYDYLFYLTKMKDKISMVAYIDPNWIYETNPFLYNKNFLKNNSFIIKNSEEKLRNLVKELSDMEDDISKEKLLIILNNDIINGYLRSLNVVLNDIIKKKDYLSIINNYFLNVENKYNSDIYSLHKNNIMISKQSGGFKKEIDLEIKNDNFVISIVTRYMNYLLE
jgi:hypothetical protein